MKAADSAADFAAFTHVEYELAETIGVEHEMLKMLRKELLHRGADWELVKNKVALSDSGKKKILEALRIGGDGAPVADLEAPPADADLAPNNLPTGDAAPALLPPPPADLAPLPKAADPVVAEMICARLPLNRRIILARHGKELVRVRVPSNEKFVAGMKLTARHLDGDLWELEGNAPRFVGRF